MSPASCRLGPPYGDPVIHMRHGGVSSFKTEAVADHAKLFFIFFPTGVKKAKFPADTTNKRLIRTSSWEGTMSISSISGSGGFTPFDRQTFGAQVVSETLDTLNNSSSSQSMAPVDKQTFGAQVVSKTLDYMNSGSNVGPNNSSDYDFQKSVLDAAYSGKGTMLDRMI